MRIGFSYDMAQIIVCFLFAVINLPFLQDLELSQVGKVKSRKNPKNSDTRKIALIRKYEHFDLTMQWCL